MLDDLAGPPVALHELHEVAEEVEAHEGRLAALPGDGDPLGLMRLEELPHVLVEQVAVHAEAAARVEGLLGEEEAVRAVEVADGAAGLDEDVEGRRSSYWPWVGQHGQHARIHGLGRHAARGP